MLVYLPTSCLPQCRIARVSPKWSPPRLQETEQVSLTLHSAAAPIIAIHNHKGQGIQAGAIHRKPQSRVVLGSALPNKSSAALALTQAQSPKVTPIEGVRTAGQPCHAQNCTSPMSATRSAAAQHAALSHPARTATRCLLLRTRSTPYFKLGHLRQQAVMKCSVQRLARSSNHGWVISIERPLLQ